MVGSSESWKMLKTFNPGRESKVKITSTITPKNFEFLEELAKKFNTTISAVLDEVLDFFEGEYKSGRVTKWKKKN